MLEDGLDKEDKEVEEEAESDYELEGGRADVSYDINENMCGELPDAVSDLWGEVTHP